MDEENKVNEEKHIPEKKDEKEKEEGGKPNNHQEGKLTKKMRENPWILSTFVLGVLALILLIGNFGGVTGGTITGGVIDEGFVEDTILNFVKSQGADAEIVSIEEDKNFYIVTILLQDQEIPLYVTKDGEYFTSSLIPLAEINEEPSQETPQPVVNYSEEDNQKIQEFSKCLADKGLRVYYAGWCGHCHTLIETFGGLENAEEIMLECQTETQQPGKDSDLCDVEDIRGFPTIKVNGEPYTGARTFEAFAEATGCSAPDISI